jgi:hypothetical protein
VLGVYTAFPLSTIRGELQAKFRGGYLRLAWSGKRLQVCVEIDSPRKLTRSELASLRGELDGQVSDGIGESGFDFVGASAGVAVETFPGLGGKGSLVQTTGEAWRPRSLAAEAAANRRRCKEAAAAVKAAERTADEERAKKGGAKADPKKLFRLIVKGLQYPQPAGIAQEIAAEVGTLGGDLGFISSGQFPSVGLRDVKLLRLLLDAGLNPNLRDREGHSLLWLATGTPACVALLLKRGADVNLRDTEVYRATALMKAAWLADLKSVQLLLDGGADPLLQDYFGQTALDLAKQNTHAKTAAATIKTLELAMKMG